MGSPWCLRGGGCSGTRGVGVGSRFSDTPSDSGYGSMPLRAPHRFRVAAESPRDCRRTETLPGPLGCLRRASEPGPGRPPLGGRRTGARGKQWFASGKPPQPIRAVSAERQGVGSVIRLCGTTMRPSRGSKWRWAVEPKGFPSDLAFLSHGFRRQFPKMSENWLPFWVDGPWGCQIPTDRPPTSFRGDLAAYRAVNSPMGDAE